MKYASELRERAVRRLLKLRAAGEGQGAPARVADRLGMHREALRTWVRQAEVDGGKRPGTTTSDAARIAEQFGVEPICAVLPPDRRPEVQEGTRRIP
ncbi:transposase [Sinosporangium album]|uniref:transposase n=1 Tax=Sinosporangium album TaxID=504805 RepID=UPI0015A164EA